MRKNQASSLTNQISRIISVCCKKDSNVWEIAHKRIIEYIDAKEYIVIVPDLDLSFFRAITVNPYQVISEENYTVFFRELLRSALPIKQSHQYGWYLQQFIKLSAINSSDQDEFVLIWDADTIPLKKIDFFLQSQLLNYYIGNEHNQPYFNTINRLTGLNKIVDFSFIAQCFPIKVRWMHEFCQLIEAKHQTDWISAILKSIDFNDPNGFSEYETLGTFLTHTHPNEIAYLRRPWCRLGNSLIGHPVFLNRYISKNLPLKFDYISFEKWDRKKFYFLKVAIPYFFRITILMGLINLINKLRKIS